MTVWHQLTEDISTWPQIGQMVCITTTYDNNDGLRTKYSLAVMKYLFSNGVKIGFSGASAAWTIDSLYHAKCYWCEFPELNHSIEIQI